MLNVKVLDFCLITILKKNSIWLDDQALVSRPRIWLFDQAFGYSTSSKKRKKSFFWWVHDSVQPIMGLLPNCVRLKSAVTILKKQPATSPTCQFAVTSI